LMLVTLQRDPPLIRIFAPGFFAPSRTMTERDGFARLRKMAVARPAAPAPTTTTSSPATRPRSAGSLPRSRESSIRCPIPAPASPAQRSTDSLRQFRRGARQETSRRATGLRASDPNWFGVSADGQPGPQSASPRSGTDPWPIAARALAIVRRAARPAHEPPVASRRLQPRHRLPQSLSCRLQSVRHACCIASSQCCRRSIAGRIRFGDCRASSYEEKAPSAPPDRIGP